MNSQSPFSMIFRESAYAVFLRNPRYLSSCLGICSSLRIWRKDEEFRKRDPRSRFVSVENSGGYGVDPIQGIFIYQYNSVEDGSWDQIQFVRFLSQGNPVERHLRAPTVDKTA